MVWIHIIRLTRQLPRVFVEVGPGADGGLQFGMVNTWEEPPHIIHRSWVGANLTGTLLVSDDGMYEIGMEMINQVRRLVAGTANDVMSSLWVRLGTGHVLLQR